MKSFPSNSRSRASPGSVLLLTSLLFIAAFAILPPSTAHAENLGSWTQTTSYYGPAPVCVTSGGYIYCVEAGGATYYAPVSSSGVGNWGQSTSYPLHISDESCVAYGGYIYCISGSCDSTAYPDCKSPAQAPTTQDYYAPLSPSGIGTWVQTSSIPIGGMYLSCAVAQSYVYCVGGEETTGTLPSNHVDYAPLSASGIGHWTATTTYPNPMDYHYCATFGGYIYCIGGATKSGSTIVNSTYYAAVSSSGVGTWTETVDYPNEIQSEQCLASSGYLYCVGGYSYHGSTTAVYYSEASPGGGIGSWNSTISYPKGSPFSCTTSSGYIYCLGNSSVYYAQVLAAQPTSTLTISTTDTNGNRLSGYYAVLNQSGSMVANGTTTATFTLNNNQVYTVQVDSYGSCHFDYWADTGSTTFYRVVSISSNTSYTAVIGCSTASTSTSSSSSSSTITTSRSSSTSITNTTSTSSVTTSSSLHSSNTTGNKTTTSIDSTSSLTQPRVTNTHLATTNALSNGSISFYAAIVAAGIVIAIITVLGLMMRRY